MQQRAVGYHDAMDIANVLTQLRQERDHIEEAIISLERMVAGQGKRRGRPPLWSVEAKQTGPTKRRGRPLGSKNRSAGPEAERRKASD